MNTSTVNSYYYGDESNQFSFFRIPRQLITGERFKHISTDAKLLYGLLLDRMGLSEQNGWYDEDNRVYIYYTLREIQRNLNCGQDKAIKLLAELDQGCNLIDRTRQGQGRPTKIYVKKCSGRKVQPTQKGNQNQDFGNSDTQTSGNQTSRLPKIGSLDLGKTESNYTEENQTELIYTDPSINPSKSDIWEDRIDGCEAENTERCKQENTVNTVCDDTPYLPAQTQITHFQVFRRIKSLLHRATAADNRDSGALRRCHSQHGILTSKFRWLGALPLRHQTPVSKCVSNRDTFHQIRNHSRNVPHQKILMTGVFPLWGSVIRCSSLSRPHDCSGNRARVGQCAHWPSLDRADRRIVR